MQFSLCVLFAVGETLLWNGFREDEDAMRAELGMEGLADAFVLPHDRPSTHWLTPPEGSSLWHGGWRMEDTNFPCHRFVLANKWAILLPHSVPHFFVKTVDAAGIEKAIAAVARKKDLGAIVSLAHDIFHLHLDYMNEGVWWWLECLRRRAFSSFGSAIGLNIHHWMGAIIGEMWGVIEEGRLHVPAEARAVELLTTIAGLQSMYRVVTNRELVGMRWIEEHMPTCRKVCGKAFSVEKDVVYCVACGVDVFCLALVDEGDEADGSRRLCMRCARKLTQRKIGSEWKWVLHREDDQLIVFAPVEKVAVTASWLTYRQLVALEEFLLVGRDMAVIFSEDYVISQGSTFPLFRPFEPLVQA
jgi:hypothetical protein